MNILEKSIVIICKKKVKSENLQIIMFYDKI